MTEAGSRIMIVEDRSEFREAVIFSLLAERYLKGIYIAPSGEEALEAFKDFSPALVLMDFRLPGINGLETAKRMKAMRPDVKIALVTAYAEELIPRGDTLECVDDIIPKANFTAARVGHLLGYKRYVPDAHGPPDQLPSAHETAGDSRTTS